MRIEQIQYLLAIHKYQSISRAAEAMFVTQPSLSRAINALEKELGVQLLHRTYQGATLTDIGTKLLPHFKMMVEEMKHIDTLLAEETAQDISATIRVSASAILCNNVLPDTINLFNQSYPRINIDVREEYDAEIVGAIEHNKADIAFLSVSPKLNSDILTLVDNKHLKKRLLLRSSIVAIVSSKSPLAKLPVITPKELYPYPLILDKKVKPYVETTVTQNITFAQDRDARTKMILKNQGYCVLSSLEMYNDYYVQEGLMTTIPYIDDSISHEGMELWIVQKKGEVKFYEQDFIDCMRKLLIESEN